MTPNKFTMVEEVPENEKPFVPEFKFGLTEADVAELSGYLGMNFSNAKELMRAARHVTTLQIMAYDKAPLTLEPYLLERLRTRCHPTEDFPKFVRDRIVELLRGFADI